MFKSKKIRLIILFSVLIFVAIGGWWSISQYQKPAADTSSAPYSASLDAKAIGAIACKSGVTSCDLNNAIGELWNPNDYPASFPWSIPIAVARYAEVILREQKDGCINQVLKQNLIGNPSTIQLPKDINLPKCKITIFRKQKTRNNEIILSTNLSTAFKGQAPATFKSVFNHSETTKEESAPSDLDVQVTYKNINFTFKGNKCTNISQPSTMDFDGNTNTNYDFKINGHDDMSGWISQAPNDPVEINYTTKKWDSYSNGIIDGHINSSWNDMKSIDDFSKPGSININSLSLCPNGCVITVSEILELEGDIPKVGEGEKPFGHFYKYQRHQEIYDGKAVGDPQTGKLEWIELTLSKDDNRKWLRNLSYPSAVYPKIRLLSNYTGSSKSQSTEFPLQGKNAYVVDTEINKNLSVKRDSDNQIMFTAAENEKKTKNTNGTITERSGSGSHLAGTYSYGGIYDLPSPDDERMKITISNDPNRLVGSRQDPFAEQDISRFIQDIVPDHYTAPGFFTASSYDDEKAEIYSKAFKAFPDNLYAFSYAGASFSSAVLKELQSLASEMKGQGVTVPLGSVPHKIAPYKKKNGQWVHMPQDLKNHLASVKANSWVILIAEGNPVGIGDDRLTWSELGKAVSEAGRSQHFRLDTLGFANISCYGGRANVVFNPLGIQVIGSLNKLLRMNVTDPVGQLININNASWDESAGSIIQTLDERFKSLSICKP